VAHVPERTSDEVTSGGLGVFRPSARRTSSDAVSYLFGQVAAGKGIALSERDHLSERGLVVIFNLHDLNFRAESTGLSSILKS
jgi:hypothetical protein